MVTLSRRLTAAAFACAILCTACQKPTEIRNVSAKLDDRTWIAVQQNIRTGEGKDYTLELVPEGTAKNDWAEIVTVQYFWTGKQSISPRQYEASLLENLKRVKPQKKSQNFLPWSSQQEGPGPARTRNIRHQVLSEGENALLFSWQAVLDPELSNQQGLIRVARLPEGIAVLQYTTKQPMSEDTTTKWRQILDGGRLQELVR